MRRPVSHIMGRVETFSSKVPVFRLSAYRMIISCPPVARLISVRRTTSSIMRETAALILPVINVAIKPARASLARPVQQWWFLWYDINYPVVAFTGVTSRRYSVSWKPFIVISSLRPHFISSVSHSPAGKRRSPTCVARTRNAAVRPPSLCRSTSGARDDVTERAPPARPGAWLRR